METRLLDILDEAGKVIGRESVEKAHADGLLHRSIHILVVDTQGRVFVRQRPSNKLIYPGLWTCSVGAHVLSGDTPEKTAILELMRFLGLDKPLEKLGEKRIHDQHENEFITVFLCRADAIPELNSAEGAAGRFMQPQEMERLTTSDQTTPHLSEALRCLPDSK